MAKYGLLRVGQSVVTSSPGAARSTHRALGIEKDDALRYVEAAFG